MTRRAVCIVAWLIASSLSLGAVAYLAFEQKTVDNTAGGVAFTATKIQPNGANSYPSATVATCRLETAEIRFTVDGTAPTTTVGTLLEVGDYLSLTGNDLLKAFRAIRTGASSGVLDCTFTQP